MIGWFELGSIPVMSPREEVVCHAFSVVWLLGCEGGSIYIIDADDRYGQRTKMVTPSKAVFVDDIWGWGMY